MLRRHFLASTFALPLAAKLRDGKLEEAIDLIGGLVEAGTIGSAAMRVEQGNFSHLSRFGIATDRKAIFLLASISKPMTAAAVMLLADRGELSLEDPAKKFLPEFSKGDRSKITIKHLLTHTSGLPDQLPVNVELRKRNAPLSEFVERAMRTDLLFRPGERYSYQSMGILLAAEICSRIAGMSFPEFMAKEVYAPLGMKDSAMGLGHIPLKATEHSQVEQGPPHGGQGKPEAGHWDWNSAYWRELASPWGGAHATADDVARFFDEFRYPERARVLKPATARLLVSNHTPGMKQSRGLGFALGSGAGAGCSAKTFWHGGATGTLAWADPETGLSFVLLTTLPSNVANKLVIRPVSNLISGAV